MTRDEALMLLSELDFTALDLQLFLNTHPHDKKALEQYNKAVGEAKRVRDYFESNFGPLTGILSKSDEQFFSWIDNPWPWDRNFLTQTQKETR